MSSRGDVKTVDIERPTYERLSEFAKKSNKSLRKYVNEVLAAHISGIDLISKRFPNIMQVGSTDSAIYIEDKKLGTVATVTLKESGQPYCSVCQEESCIHVMLALSSTDLRKLVEQMEKELS